MLFSFVVALQNFFFGHLTLSKKNADKFAPLYMKILTVHGIQQCASFFVVSAWREVKCPLFVIYEKGFLPPARSQKNRVYAVFSLIRVSRGGE